MADDTWQGTVYKPTGDIITFHGWFAPTKPHRHYAIQVVEAAGAISLMIGSTVFEQMTIAVIGSTQPHAILSAGQGTVTFLAPHSREGRHSASDARAGSAFWLGGVYPRWATAPAYRQHAPSFRD